ncbi:MAG: DNA-3-methyladenine glycosylase [Patescibacteria group bacterium]
MLRKDFYKRPVLKVAPDLIGKYLVVSYGGKITAHMITEVEAYDGEGDLACHASKGKTKRTEVMFEEGGVWYVYLIYGIYEMLNVVTGNKDHPAAVLIRGIEGFDGPGKLTKALHIDRRFNNKKAAKESGLWIEDRGEVISKKDILKLPRIGVDFAGPIWSKKKWRFRLKSF